MTSTQSDAHLIQLTLQGKRESFGTLVSRYYSLVYGIALSYTGNAGDAEDISQECFLKAYRSLDTLRESGKFRAWLARIARNECHTWRSRNPRYHASQQHLHHAEPAQYPQHERKELFEFLWSEIQNLDEAAREILVLYYFHGRNTRDVAAQLDISPDAAEKRLQRARQQLGERMSDHLDEALKPHLPTRDKAQRIAQAILAVPVTGKVVQMAPLAGAAASGAWSLSIYAWLALLSLVSGLTWVTVTHYSQGQVSAGPGDARRTAIDTTATPGDATDSAGSSPAAASTEKIPVGTDDANGGPPFVTVVVMNERDQSTPIADATVTLVSTKREAVSVKTDEQGRAHFSDWILGDVGVLLRHDRYLKTRSTHTLNHVGTTLRLTMAPGRLIAGRVVDAHSGAPVPDFVIDFSDGEPVKVHDPEGRFSFGNLRMLYGIAVHAEGYAWTVVDTKAETDTSDLTIALQGPQTVQGRVRDTSGVPIAGVHVGTSKSPRLDWDEETLREVAQTDADGMFRFPLIDPREQALVFLREGYVTTLVVMPRKPPLWADAELLKTCSVRGFIRFDKTPVEGAKVSAGPQNPDDAVTDAAGAYLLEGLEPGELSIVASLPDRPLEYGRIQASGKLVTLQQGQEAALDFDFEPALSSITGYVTVENAASTNYTLRLYSEHSSTAGIERRNVVVAPGEPFWLEEVPTGQTNLRVEARFQDLRQVRPGVYEDVRWHTLIRHIAIDVPPATEVRQDVVVASNATIQALVKGIPIGYRALVELYGENVVGDSSGEIDPCQGQHNLVSDGITTFQPLCPGTYTLTLRVYQVRPEGSQPLGLMGARPARPLAPWFNLSPKRNANANRALNEESLPPGAKITVEVAENQTAEVTLVASQ